ncbi:MAG: O-antigen ligase family protein [Oscillospiraceae bacterium]|jgi:hypothetical protein
MIDKSKRSQNLANRLTDCYLLFMLLFFPLFSGISGYRNITFAKYLCFVIPTVLWLSVLLFYRIRIKKNFCLSSLHPAQNAVLIFGIVACLSACCSTFRVQTLIGTSRYDGLLTILLYCGTFFGISQYAVFKRHHAIALAVSTTLCCLIAILQLFCLDPLRLFPGTLTYYDNGISYTGRFLGTIGNTNLLAAFLCIGIPFFTALYITEHSFSRGYWMIPASCGLFLLISSKSSGGIVALCLCALVSTPLLLRTRDRLHSAFSASALLLLVAGYASSMVPNYTEGTVTVSIVFGMRALLCFVASAICMVLKFICRFLHPCSPSRQSRILALFCVFAVCLGLSIVYWYPADSGSLYELSRILHGELSDSFGSSRIRIWRVVLDLVPEHPLLGGGPDTLSARLDLTFSRLVEETGHTFTTHVDNAHNEYLGHLVNLGTLGLAAYLSTMIASFRTWFQQRDTAVFAAIGCALFCYWVQGLFGLGLVLVNPLLWIFWALLESQSSPCFSQAL